MAFNSAQVSIGTTATLLSAEGSADGITGQDLTVINDSGVTVYLGGADVAVGMGRLVNGRIFSSPLGRSDAVYGVVATGTATVDVFRAGV